MKTIDEILQKIEKVLSGELSERVNLDEFEEICESVYSCSKQEIYDYKKELLGKLQQIVIEDVPHKYQYRLLKYIREIK